MQVTWPIMASVSVSKWTSEQVAEWLRGLDDAILPYVHFFLNNAINGQHLLVLSVDDLPHLNVTKLGHQDLILEAVDLLRHFHYGLNTENLQSLSLKLSCKARSLYNDLKHDGKQERVTTHILSSVANILVSVKCLVSWLDRNPFLGQQRYVAIKNLLLRLNIEAATNAVRDIFADKPIDAIKNCCLMISDICDKIIQESEDSLIIQPASIDVATVKKKPEDELGLYLHSSYSGIHIIGEVKSQSPAQLCGRIDVGDEVVQVNHQNVVGWQLKKLVLIMKENPTEIVLTLKKRPHHSNMLSQTFARSFFHAKKPSNAYVPRIEWQRELRVSPTGVFQQPYSQPEDSPKDLLEVEEDDDHNTGFVQEAAADESIANLFVPRPRATIQRRATVTGISPNASRAPVNFDELWIQVQKERVLRSISHDPEKLSPGMDDSCSLRNPQGINSISLPSDNNSDVPRISPRPNTCLGTDPATEAKIKNKNELSENVINKNVINIEKEVKEGIISDKEILPNKSADRNVPNAELANDKEKSIQQIVHIDRKEHFTKAASLPRTLPSSKTLSPKSQNMSNPNLFSDASLSYQVIIAGGVAHKAPTPINKEAPASPRESPVLRRKGRTWEFANRRVSCKDLGMGDCQGWLYKKKEQKGLFSSQRWIKRWCVLKNHNFYCYVEKDDQKAESLVFLPGFNVSPAPEIKTKKHSFKVYHTGTTFYYASDTQQDMSKWMNKMGLAAISYDASGTVTTSGFVRPEDSIGMESVGVKIKHPNKDLCLLKDVYYSETEYDSEEGSNSVTTDTLSELEHKAVIGEDGEVSPKSLPTSNTLPKYSTNISNKDSWHTNFKGKSECSSDTDIRVLFTKDKRNLNTWSPRTHQKSSSYADKPTSANISSISLQSVKVKSLDSCLPDKYPQNSNHNSKQLSKRVHVGRRGWVSFERRLHKREPSRDKILPTSALSPAFEMNLDSSPPPEDIIKSSVSEMLRLQQRRSSNILAKLGLSPRNEKRTQRQTQWFDDLSSSSTFSSEEAVECQNTKLISSSCQTDLSSFTHLSYFTKTVPSWKRDQDTSISEQPDVKAATWDVRKSSITSISSNQTTWEFIATDKQGEKHFRTEMTVQIGRGTDTSSDESTESTRSPRKPAMGTAMIGKHRRSATTNSVKRNWMEGSLTRGSTISISTTTQATQTDNDDDLTQLLHTLYNADLTIDGIHVGVRRTNTMLMPHSDKRRSQQMLLLRSLQRTLKSKEQDLMAIEEILSLNVTRRKLRQWMDDHPHLCQSYDQYSSSDVVESD